MKQNRKEVCSFSNKVILNRKISTMLEDEPGKITKSDFNIECFMGMILTRVKI